MFSLSASTPSQKTSIDPSFHGHVDLALKRLKLISHRLSATLTAFEEESRILDRLFYKGKNQHRISLFWKHMEEIRRLCRRINAFDLLIGLTRVRHTFYNSTSYQNQNILKASWTHVPEARALRETTRNISPMRLLLLKASKRIMEAYCSFKRVLQTGAFLQLILILSGISCRLQALIQALLELHEELVTTLRDLCNSLEVASIALMPSVQPILIEPHQSSIRLAASQFSTELRDPGSQTCKKFKVNNSKHTQREFNVQVGSENQFVAAKSDVGNHPPKTLKGGTDPTAESAVKKKRKKPADEIDAIFGF